MSYMLLDARRSKSFGGLPGRLVVASEVVASLLARRTFESNSPHDEGPLEIGLSTGAAGSTVTYWERTDTADPDIIQQVEIPSGTWWQPEVALEADHNEVWGRYEFQLASRAAGDTRTRLVGFNFNGLILGIYENDGDIEITDEGGGVGSVLAVGEGGVGNAWRVLDFQAVSDSGAGDGVLRVWMDGAATAVAEITTHTRDVSSSAVQFGLGSVGSDHTVRIAHLALFDADFRPETPVSDGWADAAPFQEFVEPVSEIDVSPSMPSVSDGAASGTTFADLIRTGGNGDGTWSLTGDLSNIAQVVGTTLELTTTVSIAGDDGTTGTVDYTGDSAGGDPDPVGVTLSVVDATTDLTLTATAGGAEETGTLDNTQPFVSIRMLPRVTPKLASEHAPTYDDGLPGYAGSLHRCGFETLADGVAGTILRVSNLDEDDNVEGSLGWCASTSVDHDGNSIDESKPCVVIFDITGHIPGGTTGDTDVHFRRKNRWFAGQTAPVNADGYAGVVHHGSSRIEADRLRIEHLGFFLGTPEARDGGPETVWVQQKFGIHNILRNCTIGWGEDGNSDITTKLGGEATRYDRGTYLYCLWSPPNYDSSSGGKRGYQGLWNDSSHRLLTFGNLWMGGLGIRGPGLKPFTSGCIVNDVTVPGYDTACCRTFPVVSYILNRDTEDHYPRFRNWATIGCLCESTPDSDFASYWNWLQISDFSGTKNGVDQFLGRVYEFMEQVQLDGVTMPQDFGGPDGGGKNWYTLDDPPLMPLVPPMPVEDVRAHVKTHAGPHPSNRMPYLVELIADWDAGNSIKRDISGTDPLGLAWDWLFPPAMPAGLMATATTTNTLPTDPWTKASNGLTNLENWLEQKHIDAGGAPYQPFGRRMRFPWGGIVTIETDGSVTFDPEDMASGQNGVVEVTRADGSIVSVTCEVS